MNCVGVLPSSCYGEFLFANQLNVTGPSFIAWPISSNCMNLKPQFLLCIAEKLPRGTGTRAFQVKKVPAFLFFAFFPFHKLVPGRSGKARCNRMTEQGRCVR